MTDFQPGDRVERINSNWNGVRIGDICVISHFLCSRSDMVHLVGHDYVYFAKSEFRLAGPRKREKSGFGQFVLRVENG